MCTLRFLENNLQRTVRVIGALLEGWGVGHVHKWECYVTCCISEGGACTRLGKVENMVSLGRRVGALSGHQLWLAPMAT